MRTALFVPAAALLLACCLVASVTAAGGVSVDASNFEELVMQDDRVFVLEFYSEMCGSCQEFATSWSTAVDKLGGSLLFGRVNIDNKAGMTLAMQLGVLDEGIPAVQVYKADSPTLVMGGAPLEASAFVAKLRAQVKGLEAGADGKLLRQ